VRSADPRARWLWRIALGLLLANGLVFVFLVLPPRVQHSEEEQHLLDLQRRTRTLQREGESGEVLLTAFREVEEYVQGFPRRADLRGLVGQLAKLARSVAVDVPTVDYKPSEVKDAGLTKVTVSMTVEGNYDKIRRYLYELEAMRRYLVIERVQLRDPKGTSELQVQLQLAVYVR
jgi:Tfp pilus assembly protein PilO